MVLSRVTSKRLQHRIARCHLLILHLMVDCHDYQHVLGHKGLETALASYWSSDHHGNESEKDEWDDEMLALSTLVQLGAILERRCNSSPSLVDHDSFCFQGLYTLYRKHIPATSTPSRYPLFQWALQLAVDVQLGLWHIVLSRLRQNDTQFGILARCCLAKSIPYLQCMALTTYNVSFAKGEAVPMEDLVRLLQFTLDGSTLDNDGDPINGTSHSRNTVEEACLAFGAQLGLPVHENRRALIFKSAPIGELPTTASARNDAFVFAKAFTANVDANVECVQRPLKEELRALLLLQTLPSKVNLTI